MDCRKCRVPMREREKDDVVVDIWPGCRGVRLDPGELFESLGAGGTD